MTKSGHVLCTGMHRSGTTWTGRALGAAFDLPVLNEPANPHRMPNLKHFYFAAEDPAQLSHLYDYAMGPSLPERTRSAVSGRPRHWGGRLHAAWHPQSCVVRDPFAFFNARLMQERYDMHVVLCLRHPADVVSSALRLGWDFDFGNLLQQRRCVRELSHWTPAMERTYAEPDGQLTRLALLWTVLHSWWRTSASAPSNFTIARHAELVINPELIAKQLPECAVNRDALRAFCADTQAPPSIPPDQTTFDDIRRDRTALISPWKRRLTEGQVDLIRQLTHDEAAAWGLHDW